MVCSWYQSLKWFWKWHTYNSNHISWCTVLLIHARDTCDWCWRLHISLLQHHLQGALPQWCPSSDKFSLQCVKDFFLVVFTIHVHPVRIGGNKQSPVLLFFLLLIKVVEHVRIYLAWFNERMSFGHKTDPLVQDCNIFIANVLEIQQYCVKSLIHR